MTGVMKAGSRQSGSMSATKEFAIRLNAEERQILTETMRNDISNLSVQIADTDRKEFRDGLKRRKEMLESVLGKLE